MILSGKKINKRVFLKGKNIRSKDRFHLASLTSEIKTRQLSTRRFGPTVSHYPSPAIP